MNEATLEKLQELRELKEGWDSYGALPINPEIIAAAKDFVMGVPFELPTHTNVVPMSEGRLQFEWHNGPDVSLEIEYETPDIVHYIKWAPGFEEEDVFPARHHQKIYELINWLEDTPCPNP